MNIQTEETISAHLKNWDQTNRDKLSSLINDQAVSLQTGLLSTLKDKAYFEWWATDNLIHDIHTFIHDAGLVIQFDWPAWKEERKQVLIDIHSDKDVSEIALVKVLTSIIRADRFSEGTFMKNTSDGTVFTIFKKLQKKINS